MGINVWLDAILPENYIQTLLELRSTINLMKLNVGIIVFNWVWVFLITMTDESVN